MDKEVLIRFIQMIETILGRVNSKRLMVYYAFLYWLYLVKVDVSAALLWAAGCGATVIILWMFYEETRLDKQADALPKSGE